MGFLLFLIIAILLTIAGFNILVGLCQVIVGLTLAAFYALMGAAIYTFVGIVKVFEKLAEIITGAGNPPRRK